LAAFLSPYLGDCTLMSKAIRLTILAPLALAWLCGSALAQGGVTNSTKNRQQIAILHWYEANLTTRFSGFQPNGVLFDGANIWVARYVQGGGLVKMRASDGAVLGTFGLSFSGVLPSDNGHMAFDGANIWVTFRRATLLQKVRASDGAILASISTPGGYIAFDGANIWVTSGGALNNLHKFRASDGALLGTFTIGPGIQGSCCTTFGIAFDGANVWVAYAGTVNTVTKIRASDGTILGTFTVGNSPGSVIFDGANIWVSNDGDHTVTKLRASDGAVLGTFPNGSGTGPTDLIFDGANIWLAIQGNSKVTKLRASDGTPLGSFQTPVLNGGGTTFGIGFDGANIWVENGDVVSKL
jgi:hypothetical protein